MTEQLTKDEAFELISTYRCWFGTPAVFFNHQCVDGRVRLGAVTALFKRNKIIVVPVSVNARTLGEVVRLLCLARHFDRAKEFTPSELRSPQDLAAWCHCKEEIVAPMCRKVRLRGPRMGAHTVVARRRAIEKMAQLYRRAKQNTGTVTADEIAEALGQWL